MWLTETKIYCTLVLALPLLVLALVSALGKTTVAPVPVRDKEKGVVVVGRWVTFGAGATSGGSRKKRRRRQLLLEV
jgi:hypothetical protein